MHLTLLIINTCIDLNYSLSSLITLHYFISLSKMRREEKGEGGADGGGFKYSPFHP